jgi:hypothetical protein
LDCGDLLLNSRRKTFSGLHKRIQRSTSEYRRG